MRVVFVLATFGLLGLGSAFVRPTLAALRVVDIVHLVGAGMCLGGAIVALVWTRSL
jgi:hypothetical protein